MLQFWREATGIQRGKLAAATAKANEAGIRYINAKVARFTTPVLVIHGTNDGVTSPSLSEDWLKRTSTDPLLKRFVPVLGAKHMMFEGRHRGTVISCVSDFVRLAMDDGRADIAVSTASIAIEEHR